MIKRIVLSFVVLAMALTMNKAFAATVYYTLTSGSDVITFSLPQAVPTPPDPCTISVDCFGDPTPVTIDGTLYSNATVNFYSPANGGGLTITDPTTVFVNNDGPGDEQLFTGTLASPGTLETFTNLQLVIAPSFGPVYDEPFLLNATTTPPAATPEPGSIVLLGSGLLGLAGAVRRKLCR